MGLKTPFEIRIVTKGLAAQSKAEAIGQNKISSANQRPGFQMIFFLFGPVWFTAMNYAFMALK